MNSGIKYLISINGSISDYDVIAGKLSHYDKVISVDGGIRHLMALKISADVAIGDFDSLGNLKINQLPEKVEIIKYPENKDATDTELAVEYAINHDAVSITMIGFMGSRIDHSLSSIFLLSQIPKNITVQMINEKNTIYLAEKKITLSASKESYVSILPLTPIVKVKECEGLEYDLTGKTLYFGSSLSVSNRAIENFFTITIKSGKALILISED